MVEGIVSGGSGRKEKKDNVGPGILARFGSDHVGRSVKKFMRTSADLLYEEACQGLLSPFQPREASLPQVAVAIHSPTRREPRSSLQSQHHQSVPQLPTPHRLLLVS